MFTTRTLQTRPRIIGRLVAFACAFIAGTGATLGGTPRTINVALDVDNYASVFSGDFAAAALTPRTFVPFNGPGNGVLNGTFTTADDYLYIAAWSDNDVQQGLLVQVKIDGQIILPDSGRWEVCATGEDLGFGSPQPTLANMTSKIGIANAGGGPSVGWKTPTLGGINNFTFPVGNPWAPVPLISTICQWMWYDNGMQPVICCDHQPPFRRGWNHDEFLIFRLRLGCVTPPSSMVAWYPFDEAFSPSTFEFVGGFHGQKINAPATVPGKAGPALELIPSGGLQRHVRVPHAPPLNLAAGGGPFAIDCWVYSYGSSGNPQFIVYKSSPPANGGGWTLFLEFNLRPTIWLDLPNSTVSTVSSVSQVAVNGWTHIAVNVPPVTPGGGTFAQFFINGVPEAPQPFSRPMTCASTTDLFMGSYNGSTINGFVGRVDEVELFNRNLTAAEALALFQAGAQGKCKNDCNGNGVSDEYDIATGTSADNDLNGIPDECDCHNCQGDANGDGVVNFLDITAVLANWLNVCP